MSQQESDKLPGSELHATYRHSGDAKQFIREHGSGHDVFRTSRFCQPCVLKPGDILATGDMVLSNSREGGNGSVFIHLTGGLEGHWIGVPARIPIALLVEGDDEYSKLYEMAVKHAREIREHLDKKKS